VKQTLVWDWGTEGEHGFRAVGQSSGAVASASYTVASYGPSLTFYIGDNAVGSAAVGERLVISASGLAPEKR
jgi:pantothenate kinase-related protein Tda10